MTQTLAKPPIWQQLQSIADHFDLGTILVKPRRAMGTNRNYFVATDRGRFLFKLIVNTTLDDIERSLPYLDRLEEHGFPLTAYYLRAPDGQVIYQDGDTIAVVLRKLQGTNPRLSEQVCREVGAALARMHMIPAHDLPPKRHWIDNDYLPEAVALARQTIGEATLEETLKVFDSFAGFHPAAFPQSIVHGDLDPTNCLFAGNQLSAFLDWQDIGVGATILDFAMTVLGFCFIDPPEHNKQYWSTFDATLYRALCESYTQVRPFTPAEREALEVAVKYVGLTQPVWSMLHWDLYHPGAAIIETNTLYWKFGIDTLALPSF